jgi:hypothetical protein
MKIRDLESLYRQLDKLYDDIRYFCHGCLFDDCRGYIWLLPRESKEILNHGHRIIEINRHLNFIDSFTRDENKVIVDTPKPKCVFLRRGSECSIYKYRPLVCRLYPLDFKIIRGLIYVVIHTDCQFVAEKLCFGEYDIIEKARYIFYSIDGRFLFKIIDYFKGINDISEYPSDYKKDDYIKILKIKVDNKNKTIFTMSKCKAVLDSKKIKELKVKIRSKKKNKK